MKNTAGIYRVVINGKSYIGSTVNLKRREYQHRTWLESNCHDNSDLQTAFNKTHEMTFEVLEEISEADGSLLIEREKYYIQKFGDVYNKIAPAQNKCVKPVYQFNLDGTFVSEYSSVHEAARILGVSVSNIIHAAQENEKFTRTAGGYFWRYTRNISFVKDKREHEIHVYDIEGNYVMSFPTYKECAKAFGINERRKDSGIINRIIRGKSCSYKGYRFSYEKVDKLDNQKLLSVKCFFPVVQIAADKKTKIRVYATAREAAVNLGVKSSSEITYAAAKGTRCKGFYWTRLGTKWSELLESPEDIEATTELEMTDVNAKNSML